MVSAALSKFEFERAADLARRAAGLSIPDSKRTMVQSRLSRRLKAMGLSDFTHYLDYLESDAGIEERKKFISALTTNVSHFFREIHHFHLMRDLALKPLIEKAKKGEKVRIWSSGCSTGQEPYSIAMTILEECKISSGMDIKILATDVDLDVLSIAKTGRYDARQIESVPEAFRSRYYEHVQIGGEKKFLASAGLREIIKFRQLNIIKPWPMRIGFDIIFCRNVLIYFSEETQATLWPRFSSALAPRGWLFLGHSERIHDPPKYCLEVSGVTSYRNCC